MDGLPGHLTYSLLVELREENSYRLIAEASGAALECQDSLWVGYQWILYAANMWNHGHRFRELDCLGRLCWQVLLPSLKRTKKHSTAQCSNRPQANLRSGTACGDIQVDGCGCFKERTSLCNGVINMPVSD